MNRLNAGKGGRDEAPIVLYTTPDGAVKVNVYFRDGNLWFPQAGIAELFGVQKAAVSKHLKNIFAEGELDENAVVSKMETTAADGKKYSVAYYGIIESIFRNSTGHLKSTSKANDNPMTCGIHDIA